MDSARATNALQKIGYTLLHIQSTERVIKLVMQTAVPDLSLGETLEAFQSVWIAAQLMSENGLIHIKEAHRESQTGKRLIDAIIFVRMK